MSDTNRAPAVYRQDLFLARQVIGQLREQVLESGEPFDVGYGPWMQLPSTPCGTAWTGWIAISGIWRCQGR